MNKWYRPFGYMLLAAMASELCGCAQTGSWLANRTSRKKSDESLAAKKKSSDSKSKDKSSKELAGARSDDSKSVATAAKNKAKSADADQTKLVAAVEESPKNSKPRNDPSAVEESLDSIAATKPTRVNSKAAEKKLDDDLDSFLSKIESPKVAKKEVAKKSAPADDSDLTTEFADQSKKAVAQLKKEVATFDEDAVNWAEDSGNKSSKAVTPVNASTAAELPDDEPKPPATVNASQKTVEPKEDSSPDSADFSFASLKKTALKKVTGAGLSALCPNAEGELATVLKGLDPSNPESLKQGLTQIGQMGANGAAAAPLLQKLLKHEDAFVRTHAALAMAQLKLTSPDSIKVVTDSLKSKDANLRSFGTVVLSEMGPQSNQVLTSLSECLNDKNGQTRLRAAEVLIRHDGFAYPALQCLLTSLNDKSENVRWLAAYSLAELAPESAEAVTALQKATKDPSSKVRVGAVYALGEIGPFANRAGDDLRTLLKSTTDEELTTAINSTLPKIAK
jgi:hypothetical protein